MTVDNISETANDSGVNTSNSANKQKKQESLVGEFLHNYAKDFDKKPNAKTLLNTIFSSDEAILDPEVEKDLQKSKAKSLEKFSDLKIGEGVNNFILKTTLGKYYVSLDNNEKSLKSILLSEYSIDPKKGKKLDEEVGNLSDKEVLELISSDKKRQEFAKKKLGNPAIVEIANFLPGKDEIQKRFEKLDSEKKEEARSILVKAQSVGTLDSIDISVLFGTGLLNKSEKAQFVYKFMPYITLEEAKSLGLLDDKEILAEKEKLVKERVFSNVDISDQDLLSLQIKELVGSIKNEDILIETQNLKKLLDGENLDKIANPASRGFIELDKGINDSLKNDQAGANSSIELRRRLDNILTVPRNFSKGNVIKIPGKEGKEDGYIRIDSFDDVNKKFIYTVIGAGNRIDLKRGNSYEIKTYFEIEKLLKEFYEESGKKIQVFTLGEIKEDKSLVSYDLELISEQDYKNSSKKINEDLLSTLNVRKEQLEQQIQDIDSKLTQSTGIEKESLEFQKEELKKRLNDLNSNVKNLNNNELSSKKTVSLYNFQQLLTQLDNEDSAGTSLALNKGIFIEIEESGNKVSFEILGVDLEKGEVSMRGADGIIENISFAAFFEAFRDKKAKRIAQIRDFSDLIEKSAWKGFEFSSGKFIKKGTDGKKDEEINMLFSDKASKGDGKSILKIESIDGDYVTVRYGELDVKNSTKKKGKRETKLVEKTYSMSKTTHTIKLNNLHNFIEQYKFTPLPEDKKEEKIGTNFKKNKNLKGDFISRLLNNYSIAELISGGNMALQAIQERLKRGTDIHSTKIAASIGKWIPGNVGYDLQMKAEDAEKSETEKEIANLGKIDTKDSIPLIKSRIKNRDTPDYKKEAALLFMAEKYASLTGKGEMFEYRGKFIWYEAFGGKIGDDLYKEHEKYCEKYKLTFSEEDLMLKLLKKQCLPNGYKGKKRRSRLHKEFEAKKNKGAREGFQKGYDDAKNKNDITEMIDGGFGEATGGTTVEVIGWMKRAAEKCGKLEEMNQLGFELLFSGMLDNADTILLNEIKGLWDGQKIPMITAIFSKNKDNIDLFNNVVLDLTKDLDFIYPGIRKKALDIKELIKNKADPKTRLELVRVFYKEYGKPIMRAMNMGLSGNDSDFKLNKAEKFILLNKDSNSNYQRFYNSLATENSFGTMGTFGEASMTDDWGDAGLGFNLRELTKLYIKYNRGGGFVNSTGGSKAWEVIKKDFDSIGGKIIDLNSQNIKDEANIKAQKRYVILRLRDLIAGFLDNHGGDTNILGSYNNPTSSTGKALNKWGLYLKEFVNISKEDLINGLEDHKLDQIADNILSGGNAISAEQNNIFQNPFDVVRADTSSKVDKALKQAQPILPQNKVSESVERALNARKKSRGSENGAGGGFFDFGDLSSGGGDGGGGDGD